MPSLLSNFIVSPQFQCESLAYQCTPERRTRLLPRRMLFVPPSWSLFIMSTMLSAKELQDNEDRVQCMCIIYLFVILDLFFRCTQCPSVLLHPGDCVFRNLINAVLIASESSEFLEVQRECILFLSRPLEPEFALHSRNDSLSVCSVRLEFSLIVGFSTCERN